MDVLKREEIHTTPFGDQKPGTSGLRKPTRYFFQEKYIENFTQAIFNCEGSNVVKGSTIVLGGDGRYGTLQAIQKIVPIAAANGVARILIARNGILSTPAASWIIRKYEALGGILLTASHNPGGPDGDFGIKYNGRNGGPAPDQTTNNIFEISNTISNYYTVVGMSFSLEQLTTFTFNIEGNEFKIEVLDAVGEYLELMKEIFEFDSLKAFLSNFPILINCMNGVTGPYAKKIFIDELGCCAESVINSEPLLDFGGLHPDPNLTYAADLLELMKKNPKIGFGVAYDGDGDRNMILGRNAFFVNPSDSLAVLLASLGKIKWFQKIHGVARSMPTSMAVDRVAEALNLPCYEVPTGWKYFGNLMDDNKISLCGEESFGTGSVHIREKDGIWTSLLWLSVLELYGEEVESRLKNHWSVYGRNYYGRYDYENVEINKANELMKRLEDLFKNPNELEKLTNGKEFEIADNFSYKDSVDGSLSSNQGLRIIFKDGSRLVWRLSGTGSSGATVRLYLESYRKDELDLDIKDAIGDILSIALDISNLNEILGVEGPTVIT